MASKFGHVIPLLLLLMKNGDIGPNVENFIQDMKQFTSESANMSCILAVDPPQSINIKEDAEAFYRAIHIRAIDKIIEIISHRSLAQRLTIANEFNRKYKKNLLDEIDNLNSIGLSKFSFGLLSPPWEFHAKELFDAMNGWGTDEDIIIETLVPLSNNAVQFISNYYEKKYGSSLVDDIKGDTSGDFQSLLVFLSAGVRNETNLDRDDRAAAKLAKILYKYPNAITFNYILATASIPDLRKIFVEYKKISGNKIEAVIENHFYGDLKSTYLSIVEFAKNTPAYFANLIYKSRIGHKIYQLMRVLVGRSDIDLGNIKAAFKDIYGLSIADHIREVYYSNSDFRKVVLALVGP